jgi:hypothetical protein
MDVRTIANVSWGDHVEWGEGSSRLATADDIARSVERWVTRDGARRIHFREHEYYRRHGRIVHGTWRNDLFESRSACDENAEILRRGHEAGLPVWLYVTIYDELWLDTDWAWPWDPGTNWLSDYVRDHPEDVLVDRAGQERLWGVLDYNADAARTYRVGVIEELLGDRDWDGVFVCTRSQSRPAAHGDQFGFNEPSARRYRERHGTDPRTQPFDLDAWRDVRGEGLTRLLRDLRVMTDARGIGLAVGMPRADVLGPPIGNLVLDWRGWAQERLVDALVIGQISEICPSAWVHLWPETPVEGHLADPVRGTGMRPLAVDLDEVFGPVCAETGTELYLSRLHDEPDPVVEAALLADHPQLAGIQYSTFRRDLGAEAARMPWRRTLQWPEGRNAWDPERGLVRAERP